VNYRNITGRSTSGICETAAEKLALGSLALPYVKLTAAIVPVRRFAETPMYSLLAKLLGDETGATAIEYGLIAALIAVAAVSVITNVGKNLSTTFNTVSTKL